MQPSTDVRAGARRATQMQARTIRRSRRIAAGADQEESFRNSLWSALQTHLQGVDGATLAMVPEKTCRHCAALLSRLMQNNSALKGRQGKASPRSSLGARRSEVPTSGLAPRQQKNSALRSP